MNDSHTADFQWVTHSDDLSQLALQWRSLDALFIDTEFHREKTFYPELALIQIFDGQHCYLIEPVAADHCPPFIELLTLESLRKVFHSASEDCEVLYRRFGCRLVNLWDTQIAAAYLGDGLNLGYAAMIQQYCDHTLEKGATRSDWLQRPLSAQQLQYAIDDVLYLGKAYQQQMKLTQSLPNSESWVTQDCEQLAARVDELDDIESAYLDIKNGWKLSNRQLQRLKNLVEWRERLARERDVPKSFVLKNDVLFTLAHKGLLNDQRLPDITNWHPASKRRYSEAIIHILKQPYDEALQVKAPLSPKFWQEYTHKLQQAKDVVASVAQTLGFEPDVICSKKLLRRYASFLLGFSNQPPRGWTSLREQYLGEQLHSIFQE